MDYLREVAIREAMFRHLDQIAQFSTNESLSYQETAAFEFNGERIVMRQTQGRGIHKPRQLSAALSITTAYSASTASRPYDDGIGEDGYQRYKYEGTDPMLAANRSLRSAMEYSLPLAYFVGVSPGRYKAIYPIYVIADDPGNLEVALGFQATEVGVHLDAVPTMDRSYALRETKQRLHQPRFREQVLIAYKRSCAICELRHTELLDAAHIIKDSDPAGDAIVPNGLALCKIHHAAYDGNLLGIRPDSVVELNRRLLEEVDGPMLRHGFQEMHGLKIQLPSRRSLRPDPNRLATRYEEFLAAG